MQQASSCRMQPASMACLPLRLLRTPCASSRTWCPGRKYRMCSGERAKGPVHLRSAVLELPGPGTAHVQVMHTYTSPGMNLATNHLELNIHIVWTTRDNVAQQHSKKQNSLRRQRISARVVGLHDCLAARFAAHSSSASTRVIFVIHARQQTAWLPS